MNWIKTLTFPSFRYAVYKAAKLVHISYKALTIRMLLSDFWSVLRSVGFVAIPAALVGIIFLFLGQGRDTLLILIERMMDRDWFALICLLFAVAIWSVFSELSVRYAIAVSDNSGMNLSDQRVNWRKTIQKLLAALFLLWPGFLVLVGLIWAVITAEYIGPNERWLYGGLATLFILLVQLLLCELYFGKSGKGYAGNPKRTILGHRSLPPLEQSWLGKLYGIYNDYAFTLPKATNFKGPYRAALKNFTDLYASSTSNELEDLPKSAVAVSKRRLVPSNFTLTNAKKIRNSTALYKWIYCIPPSFYAVFHQHVKRMALTSFIMLVLLALVPSSISFYEFVGAPALVCLAFACYTGLYSGLLYFDRAVIPRWPVGIRMVMTVWILFVSFVNNDHPVRQNGASVDRPTVQVQFKKWFKEYKERFDRLEGDTQKRYPVIFVCAEGGAFRTGAYTALFLTQIEANLKKRNEPLDFRRGIFAMSGVSGGAVGLGFYNAVAFRSRTPIIDTNLVEKTRKFFLHDSLSPIIGRMFYGEFFNLFYWKNLEIFDRAVILEQSWENAYGEFAKERGEKDSNTYHDPFILSDTGAVKPMFLINTAQVETGLQCWVTNARPNGLLFQEKRDLLANKLVNTRYSTAINFSSRFPLFSPAAMVTDKKGGRVHYLDGGYVENTGAASMLELLQLLKSTPEYEKITPVVISLRFTTDTTEAKGIRMLNELNEVVTGILSTRAGRSNTAVAMLKKEVESNGGLWINAPLTPAEKQIPMNWVLSVQSMNRIQRDIHDKLAPNGRILQDFFKNGTQYMPLKK